MSGYDRILENPQDSVGDIHYRCDRGLFFPFFSIEQQVLRVLEPVIICKPFSLVTLYRNWHKGLRSRFHLQW